MFAPLSCAVSPRCRTHLCCCPCCGRITQPTHTHQIHREAAATEAAQASSHAAAAAASSQNATAAASSHNATAAAAASDLIRFSLSRCARCAFPSLLPAASASDRTLPALLPSASSPLLWPLPRVLALQVALDADAAVAARTASYLAKLDEFRALSRSLPSSGSQQQQQQALHYQRSGGAQGHEESKSQEEASPPSSAASASHSAAAIASRVEQQLLHSRDQLLQCIEAKERWAATSGSSDAPVDAPGELTHPEFTATHLRILQLLCGSTSAAATAASAASSADDSPSLLPASLIDSISLFLSERRSILQEKQQVESAWRIVQSVLHVQADRAAVAQSHASSASATAAASASAASIAASSDLSALSVSVLLNVLHCRFQRAEYLLQLRVEAFQPLLTAVSELLLRVYDAMAASAQSRDDPAVPPPPASNAPVAVRAAWKSIVAHSAAIAHAAATPASYRSVDLAAVTIVELRSVCPSLLALAPSDLVACAELLQRLYCDVHSTIAMQPHNLEARRAALFPVASSAAAAPATSSRSPVLGSSYSPHHDPHASAVAASAASDGYEDDVSMSPPLAATPSAAQITPRPHRQNHHSARKAARMQQQQQQPQQRHAAAASTFSAIKFPNALYRAQHRQHPYVQR